MPVENGFRNFTAEMYAYKQRVRNEMEKCRNWQEVWGQMAGPVESVLTEDEKNEIRSDRNLREMAREIEEEVWRRQGHCPPFLYAQNKGEIDSLSQDAREKLSLGLERTFERKYQRNIYHVFKWPEGLIQ